MVVDAKVSLNAFVELQNLETKLENLVSSGSSNHFEISHIQQSIKDTKTENLKAIKNHIKTLSSKSYQTRWEQKQPLQRLDFVVMFVPIESALYLAQSLENNLFEQALIQGVMLTTPQNLMMVLRLIEQVWRSEKLDKTALKVVESAHKLIEDFERSSRDLEKMHSNFQSCQNHLDSMTKRFNRNLEQTKKLAKHN